MDFEAFEAAMADLEEDTLLEMTEEAAAMGKEGADAAVEACQRGMQTIGERFEEGEYFIGDLVYAGEIMGEVMDILQPILATGDGSGAEPAKLVLAT
ncbi:MAG: B12-binding domain-containing protein, partial [Eggerthellaceae bacterium]|nr:B12-binding domain-containing protein [Eggerthellaceae bacterium]